MRTLQMLQAYLHQTWCGVECAVWVKTRRDRHMRLLIGADVGLSGRPDAFMPAFFPSLPSAPSSSSSLPAARYDVFEKPPDAYIRYVLSADSSALVRFRPSEPDQPLALTDGALHTLGLYLCLLEAEETIEVKDKVLAKLIESTRSIASSLDIESVIHDLIRNTLTVIPAADAGLLHLYDPELERLVPKAAVGFRESVIHRFRLRVGESIAGKVYLDGKPRIFHTHKEIQAAMADLSIENYQHLDDAKELRHLHGLMCVPISRGVQRIGVLVIHQFHQENVFLESDLRILQDVADLTAVALENARLYADTKAALEQTAKLTEELKAKHDDLVKRTQIHETLKRLSLRNNGTEAIASALGKMVGKPLLLIDWLEQRHYPPHSELRELFSWDELTLLVSSRLHPRWISVSDKTADGWPEQPFSVYIYPLANGSVFLGCLLIRADSCTLSDLERITIEQGIAILALDLVKKQSLSSVFYKRSHDLFQHLLTAKGAELSHQAQSIGLMPGATYLCVHAMLLRCYDLSKQEAHIHRIVHRWKQLFNGWEVITYGFHNQLTMLIEAASHAHPRSCAEKLGNFAREWNQQEDCQIAIGVGGAYSGLEQIAKSFEEAKKAVQYLNNRNRFGVVRYGELGVNQLMINQTAEDMAAFVRDVFRPFWENRAKYLELEKTLLVYIQCSQSAQETANELHIHINTLYQRLRKIEALLNIDFKRPEDMLKIQLACHLRNEAAGAL